MVGDTNLFLRTAETKSGIGIEAEAEIMIAEKVERGKKFGWEALCLMINYGVRELNVSQFEAKIKYENQPSIHLFQKIGFTEASRSDVFREITYILGGSQLTEFDNKVASITKDSAIVEYHH